MKLNDKVYDVLKWIALVAIDAIAVFFNTVSQAWGMDMSLVNPIVTTLNALGLLLGTFIGVSAAQYNKKLGGK